jgi:hypothetical protein
MTLRFEAILRLVSDGCNLHAVEEEWPFGTA